MCYAEFVNKSYDDYASVYDLINYVTRPDHAISQLIGGIGASYISVEIAVAEFWAVKNIYHKLEGRQMKHLFVSFDKSEHVSAERALYLGYQIAGYFKNRFQIIFGVHENAKYIHLHFAINTVSYIDGLKYNEGPYDQENLRCYIEDVTCFKCTWG